ncbi:MAG: hypothetical protein RLZZ458_2599 [Planctomycetota bacterium]
MTNSPLNSSADLPKSQPAFFVKAFFPSLIAVACCCMAGVILTGFMGNLSVTQWCSIVVLLLCYLYFRGTPIAPNRITWLTLLLALPLAGLGLFFGSPWCVCLSLAACCFVRFDSVADRFCAERRLSSFAFIPLLITGLPNSLDAMLHQTHSEFLASLGSSIARICCVPQIRDDFVLSFASGQIDTEAFTIGLWHPVTALLLMAFWGIAMGRSAIQMLVSMIPACGVALFVSAFFCGLDTLAVMRGSAEFFSRWPQIGLLCSVPLLLSADALVLFFTSPLEDPDDVTSPGEVDEVRLDPLVVLWNQWVAGFQPSYSLVASFEADNGTKVRLLPSLLFACGNWLGTRSKLHFLCSLASVVAFAILCATPFTIYRSRSFEVEFCKLHLEGALRAADRNESEFTYRSLLALQPHDGHIKFTFAKWLWKHNQQSRAVEMMQSLAPTTAAGYGPAHLWLVETSPTTAMPNLISEADRIHHLLHAITDVSTSAELSTRARTLLARCLLESAEPQLAMWHLEVAAQQDPRLLLELGSIQKLKGKSLQGDSRLKAYRETLLTNLKNQPHQAESAIYAARASLLLEEPREAAAILRNALPHTNTPELRHLLADICTFLARRIWDSRTVDINAMLSLLQEASSLKTANPATFLLLVELELLGVDTGVARLQDLQVLAEFASSFNPSVNSNLNPNSADSNKLEAALLAAILLGHSPAADRAAAIACAQCPRLATRAVSLYQKLGQPQKSIALANEAIRTFEASGPDQVADIVKLLKASKQFQELREICDEQGAPGSWSKDLAHTYHQALIDEFDSRLQAPPTGTVEYREWLPTVPAIENGDELLALLEKAAGHPTTRLLAVDRLARLMLTQSPLKESAAAMLRASRVDASDVAQMLEMAGYVALQTSHFAEASAWLEQAVVVCRNPHPALLNNLAIAMLRHDPLNLAPRALLFVEQALKLEPNRAELICTRAEIRLALKRWAEAQKDLRLVLDQKPNHPEALRLLRQVANIATP